MSQEDAVKFLIDGPHEQRGSRANDFRQGSTFFEHSIEANLRYSCHVPLVMVPAVCTDRPPTVTRTASPEEGSRSAKKDVTAQMVRRQTLSWHEKYVTISNGSLLVERINSPEPKTAIFWKARGKGKQIRKYIVRVTVAGGGVSTRQG